MRPARRDGRFRDGRTGPGRQNRHRKGERPDIRRQRGRTDQGTERRQPGPSADGRGDARLRHPRIVLAAEHPDHPAARRAAGERGHAGSRHPSDIRQLPCRRERSPQLLFRSDRRLHPQLRRKRHAGILPPRYVDRAQPQQIFHRPALRRGQMDRRRVERHPPLYGREMERIPLRHRVLGNLERARSGSENVDGNARSVQRLLRYGGPGAEKAVPAPEVRRAGSLRFRRGDGESLRRELREARGSARLLFVPLLLSVRHRAAANGARRPAMARRERLSPIRKST